MGGVGNLKLFFFFWKWYCAHIIFVASQGFFHHKLQNIFFSRILKADKLTNEDRRGEEAAVCLIKSLGSSFLMTEMRDSSGGGGIEKWWCYIIIILKSTRFTKVSISVVAKKGTLTEVQLIKEKCFSPHSSATLYISCGVGSTHKKVHATKGSITRIEFIKSNRGKISGQLHHQTVNRKQFKNKYRSYNIRGVDQYIRSNFANY